MTRQLPAVGSALTLPDGTTGRVIRHTVEEGQRVAVLSGTGAHEGETHHVASRDLA